MEQTPFLLTISDNISFENVYAKDSSGFTDILAKQHFIELHMDIDDGKYVLLVKFGKNYSDKPNELDVNPPFEEDIRNTRKLLADVTSKCSNPEKLKPQLSEIFLVPDKVSPIPELSVSSRRGDLKENTQKEVENLPYLSSGSDRKKKRTVGIQKRMMCRMADTNLIFGSEMDLLFTRSEPKVIEKIQLMNHATRTYLAVKFIRQNVLDFEMKCKIKYSFKKICWLLNVTITAIRRIVKQLTENERLNDYMKRNKFMTSVELNPRSHEHYFKRYATNYNDLKEQGLFRKQK